MEAGLTGKAEKEAEKEDEKEDFKEHFWDWVFVAMVSGRA